MLLLSMLKEGERKQEAGRRGQKERGRKNGTGVKQRRMEARKVQEGKEGQEERGEGGREGASKEEEAGRNEQEGKGRMERRGGWKGQEGKKGRMEGPG